MLIGHDKAWTTWRSALAGERMHHAWLLAGKEGIGKMQFAQAAARELVRDGARMAQHPDIHTLTYGPKDDKEARKQADDKPFERARSIRIAQIRDLQYRLTTRPSIGDRRAVIIDPADDMERNAANALLKSLEEPPAGTYFLLVSHRPAKLLPTIRSRCQLLRFPALTEEELSTFLKHNTPEVEDATRRAAIATAVGSPGAALSFLEQDLGELADLMNRILQDGDPGFVLRGRLASTVGARPDRDRLKAVLELARGTLSNGIGSVDPPGRVARISAHEELVRLSGEMPTYNYDPGLLVMEIGTLLAKAGGASERAHA